jgi:hypothetical protein
MLTAEFEGEQIPGTPQIWLKWWRVGLHFVVFLRSKKKCHKLNLSSLIGIPTFWLPFGPLSCKSGVLRPIGISTEVSSFIGAYKFLYCQDLELVIGFTEHLQNVTTSNYSLAEIHAPEITATVPHMKYSQFAVCLRVVAWWRIPTLSSASLLTVLPAGDSLTTNSLLQLSTLN